MERAKASSLELYGRRQLGARVRAFVESTLCVWAVADVDGRVALVASEVTASAWTAAKLPLHLALEYSTHTSTVKVSCWGRARRSNRPAPPMLPEWTSPEACALRETLRLAHSVGSGPEGPTVRVTATVDVWATDSAGTSPAERGLRGDQDGTGGQSGATGAPAGDG
jgi:hypothetical protein